MPTIEGELLKKWRTYFNLSRPQLRDACPEEIDRNRVYTIETQPHSASVATLLNIIRGLERAPRGFNFGGDDGLKLATFFIGPERLDAQRGLVGAARNVVKQNRALRR